MAITGVNSGSNSIPQFNFFTVGLSDEAKQIIAKLHAHGITPSGNKTVDRAKLHEIEVQEAQSNTYVTGNFITVTKEEEQQIIERKAEAKEQPQNFEDLSNSFDGATALGNQIYLAIKMKKR